MRRFFLGAAAFTMIAGLATPARAQGWFASRRAGAYDSTPESPNYGLNGLGYGGLGYGGPLYPGYAYSPGFGDSYQGPSASYSPVSFFGSPANRPNPYELAPGAPYPPLFRRSKPAPTSSRQRPAFVGHDTGPGPFGGYFVRKWNGE